MSFGSPCPTGPVRWASSPAASAPSAGDIVAINILERDEGHAVDEFVIEIGGDDLIELLQSEIHEVDGVSVLEIRAADTTTSAG